MDALWDYVEKSPILVIVIVLAVAYLFSRIASAGRKADRSDDLVPHYRRFDRRDIEFGDRRKREGNVPPEGVERNAGRRTKD